MSSLSIQLPVAIILLGGGLVATFSGYRLFRALLVLYGFICGVVIASLLIDGLETWMAIGATLVGGLLGAALVRIVWVACVALIGASLAVFALHLIIDGDPNVWLVVATSFGGAVVLVKGRQHVLITGTAFGGSWMAIVGGMALFQQRAALAVTAGDLSQLFPMAPLAGQRVFAIAWLVVGVLGLIVQSKAGVGSVRQHAQKHQK